MNEKQELVAYSDQSPVMDNREETEILRPLRVDASGNPVSRSAFQEYQKTGKGKLSFEAAGERYLASITDFPPDFGKPWKVGVVVPENDFIGEVKSPHPSGFIDMFIFFNFIINIGIFLARRISRPILLLAEETDQIRKFQLGEPLISSPQSRSPDFGSSHQPYEGQPAIISAICPRTTGARSRIGGQRTGAGGRPAGSDPPF